MKYPSATRLRLHGKSASSNGARRGRPGSCFLMMSWLAGPSSYRSDVSHTHTDIDTHMHTHHTYTQTHTYRYTHTQAYTDTHTQTNTHTKIQIR